jgi:hypothetical protein
MLPKLVAFLCGYKTLCGFELNIKFFMLWLEGQYIIIATVLLWSEIFIKNLQLIVQIVWWTAEKFSKILNFWSCFRVFMYSGLSCHIYCTFILSMYHGSGNCCPLICSPCGICGGQHGDRTCFVQVCCFSMVLHLFSMLVHSSPVLYNLSKSSSSSSWCGVGPFVNPFRAHTSRSVLNGLPCFLMPFGL